MEAHWCSSPVISGLCPGLWRAAWVCGGAHEPVAGVCGLQDFLPSRALSLQRGIGKASGLGVPRRLQQVCACRPPPPPPAPPQSPDLALSPVSSDDAMPSSGSQGAKEHDVLTAYHLCVLCWVLRAPHFKPFSPQPCKVMNAVIPPGLQMRKPGPRKSEFLRGPAAPRGSHFTSAKAPASPTALWETGAGNGAFGLGLRPHRPPCGFWTCQPP